MKTFKEFCLEANLIYSAEEELVDESLADMFMNASNELNKKGETHAKSAQDRLRKLNSTLEKTYGKAKPTRSSSEKSLSSQERIKVIKKKLSDAEQEMARQDAEKN